MVPVPPFEDFSHSGIGKPYARARRGEVAEFTGLSSPYEVPVFPEVALPTHVLSPEECVQRLMGWVDRRDAQG